MSQIKHIRSIIFIDMSLLKLEGKFIVNSLFHGCIIDFLGCPFSFGICCELSFLIIA